MGEPADGVDSPVTPRLVTVAHGTRKTPANAVAVRTTALAAQRMGIGAVTAYVELSTPLLGDVLAATAQPTVVLPMLLSTGYHLRHDLPRALEASAGPALLGRSLGPHALLARAQVSRLREAGAVPGSPLVMVAAGSSDELATRDLERAAQLLAHAWGASVRVATLSGRGERPEDVVRRGDCVSRYLLAGGFFADRLTRVARDAGAHAVAEVIGSHPDVVELVCRRTRALLAARVPGSERPVLAG
ncbi:cobalamin biosynthesis protein CbiX [Marmoricola endophyticus]|uniref:Cobalamin biosynthesis protein CbiX n=1 Tax=Marmoricola endophyticus TaxID=2040280 RepID=A0A917BPZ3_9ACTN|nr:CbiX/SirB N-terminal domain-containing protein [Marmoricola endophyticus]GGF53353.1 cobalamin biosynthesis protein CbiX [Marmoricola endophyticus]